MSLQSKYEDIFFAFYDGRLPRGAFLDALYNQFGPFKVQVHDLDGKCTKRRDWLEARDMPFFMENVNHRTPCPCEILFDIDLPAWLNTTERHQLLDMTLRRLRETHNIHPLVFDTGKGFHLHWFDDALAQEVVHTSIVKAREERITKLLADVRCDMMMIRGNNTLQLEGVKHWKRNTLVKPILCSS